MTRSLVWVPPAMDGLGDVEPEELEVVATPTEPAISPRLGDVEMVVTGPGQAGLAELYPKMGALRVIQTTSAGVDAYLAQVPHGVTLCSARGAYSVVAEWVVAAILADYKDFPELRDTQREQRWGRVSARRLAGSKVLLLGYGSIGRGVEERLEPFGVEFLRVARHPRPGIAGIDEIPSLLPQADVVVLLVPLTDETSGLVDAAFLAEMKPGSLLVNVARGKVVDTDALLGALSKGALRAVLDVTDPEPLPDGHPLFSAPGVFITPHIAGGALARPEVLEFLRGQLGRFARGEELENVVREGY